MQQDSWRDQFKNSKNRNNFPFKKTFLIYSCKTLEMKLCLKTCNASFLFKLQLRTKISNFPPIFNKNDFTTNDSGESMKSFAEENNLLKQPQRMISSTSNLLDHILTFTPSQTTVKKINTFYNTHRVSYSIVSFSLLLKPGEPLIKIYYQVW